MAAKSADVPVDDLAKALFVGRQLPNRKRVDVDDAHLFVGLDDAIADDSILAARTPGRKGAAGSSDLASAAAADEAENGQGTDDFADEHLNRRVPFDDR